MKQVAAMLLCLAGIATVQAFSFQGNVAGPCTLSAVYPSGNANCPAADSERAKCQKNFKVQPDGQQIAGNGTIFDPILVPVKATYEDNAECNNGAQYYNVSVYNAGSLTLASLTVATQEGDKNVLDSVVGNSASPAVLGTHKASSTATACQFTYTVNSGACFLSDVPSTSGGSWPAVSAGCLLLSLAAAAAALL